MLCCFRGAKNENPQYNMPIEGSKEVNGETPILRDPAMKNAKEPAGF